MEVEYTLDLDDWLAYHVCLLDLRYAGVGWHHYVRDRVAGRIMLLLVLLLSGSLPVVMLFFCLPGDFKWSLETVLVLVFLMMIGLFGCGLLVDVLVTPTRESRVRKVSRALEKAARKGSLKLGTRYRIFMTAQALTEITELRQTKGDVEISERVESTAPWTSIRQVIVTGEHAFFLAKPARWLILPRRAFPDDEHFQEFVEKARQYRQATGSHSGPG